MAHERFLDLTRRNANCGFTGPMLLQMFFRGIDHEMRNMINAATPGNDIYGIPVDEAFKVIESVAKKKSASLKMKPEWVEVGSNESKANPRHIAPSMYKVAATSHELDEMKETVEAHKAKCSDLETIIKKQNAELERLAKEKDQMGNKQQVEAQQKRMGNYYQLRAQAHQVCGPSSWGLHGDSSGWHVPSL